MTRAAYHTSCCDAAGDRPENAAGAGDDENDDDRAADDGCEEGQDTKELAWLSPSWLSLTPCERVDVDDVMIMHLLRDRIARSAFIQLRIRFKLASAAVP